MRVANWSYWSKRRDRHTPAPSLALIGFLFASRLLRHVLVKALENRRHPLAGDGSHGIGAVRNVLFHSPPFNPYVIILRRERTPSFAVASTPTVVVFSSMDSIKLTVMEYSTSWPANGIKFLNKNELNHLFYGII